MNNQILVVESRKTSSDASLWHFISDISSQVKTSNHKLPNNFKSLILYRHQKRHLIIHCKASKLKCIISASTMLVISAKESWGIHGTKSDLGSSFACLWSFTTSRPHREVSNSILIFSLISYRAFSRFPWQSMFQLTRLSQLMIWSSSHFYWLIRVFAPFTLSSA